MGQRDGTNRVSVAFSEAEIAEIDKSADRDGSTRSAWIRETALMRARGTVTIVINRIEVPDPLPRGRPKKA